MRRLIALAALAACAQPGMPPGGPTDPTPPSVVRLRPDTNAVNVRADAVTLEFDEVVSQRPRGAASLEELFLISPSPAGVPRLSWRRTRIAVSPPGGFRPNTTYTVEMLPGLADLEGNADSLGLRLVFSTGPALDSVVLVGRVFDWLQARPARAALVEAIALPDSARYRTTADTSGAFAIRHMAPGRYLLRALIDENSDREVGPRELFDTITVEVRDSLQREMLAAIRDSLGPGIATVEMRDSVRLRVTLDRALDTAFALTTAPFTLQGADSAVIAIDSVFTQAQLDTALADSARAAAARDSAQQAAIADSIRRADTTAAATPPTGRRPGAQVAIPLSRRDTLPPPPRPSAEIPVQVLYLRPAQPLSRGESFRLTADSLRSITGAWRSSTRVFTTPRARADTTPADTGAARRDTILLRSRGGPGA